MSITEPDPRPQNLSPVCLIVTIGVLQENHVCAIGGNGTPGNRKNPGADIESFGEYSDHVRDAVVIPVLENLDAVPGVLGAHLVGIVESFHYPESPPVIPVHGDWVDHVGFGRKKRYFKAWRDLSELQGFRGSKGILDLVERTHWIFRVLGSGRRAVAKGGKVPG